MMKTLAKIIISAMLLTSVLNAKVYQDETKAFKQMELSGKPMVAFYISDTCGYCHKQLNGIINSKSLARILGKYFVVLIITKEKTGRPASFMDQNSPTPTTVVLDSESNIIANIKGYIGADELYNFLVSVVKYEQENKENGNNNESKQ